MKLQYIIQIEDQDYYPFDGVKQGCANVKVRTSLHPTKSAYFQAHSKIHKLMNIKSSLMIQIVKVTQTKGKKFQIDYEYVPDALKNSPKMNEASFIPVLKDALTQLCRHLAGNSIKYQLKFDDIGITQSGAIKVYIVPKFQIVSPAQQQNLEEEYQIMVQKLMETNFNYRQTVKSPSDHTFVSDYSHRVNKKLTQFEDRLNKMKKYGKNTFSCNESKNDDKIDHKNLFLDIINSKKPVRQNTVATGLTSNSLIHQKKSEEVKPHKFSFADYTTSSNKLDDSSSKQSSLTQRINTALEKTQVAFKVYEKYSRKKSRKRS